MSSPSPQSPPPAILAPAGSRPAFLAALAAGADAIYCGLKRFSARMEAKNFSLKELIPLTELAHAKGVQVHIPLNALVKPDELSQMGRILATLSRSVRPDGLIIQDPALLVLARQVGFTGQIHLSTLANLSFPQGLQVARKLGADRVVLPRELSVDEIKAMAEACPPGLELEVFIHGALCYGVSGRCYWSSYLGGKSGLRGRCVQPCRRLYRQNQGQKRFFSCQDLSLDVLVKVLKSVPPIRAWKIEGRKKGPHYVYYTVSAYRMLRDAAGDPKIKKSALGLLAQALGRPGTHYHFLPQRPQNPVAEGVSTSSGLELGRIKGKRESPYLNPRLALLPGDLLRIGTEDQPGHRLQPVNRAVPKGGRLSLKPPAKGAISSMPVFLIDRREKALADPIAGLEKELSRYKEPQIPAETDFQPALPKGGRPRKKAVQEIAVKRMDGPLRGRADAFWLDPAEEGWKRLSRSRIRAIQWWLAPVIWPDEADAWEMTVQGLLKAGARQFVLNSPWQMAFFGSPRSLDLWAGPFCNLLNPLALEPLAKAGFKGAMVSPEGGRADYPALPAHSPLPLGVVISGFWPLTLSRVLPPGLDTKQPFISPKGESFWAARHGENLWLYPNWKLDIRSRKARLEKAGYVCFVHLLEKPPEAVSVKKRPGLWNWELGLS